ncbi:MAG TPA: hypothetical protein V6D17_22510 [Candidatus Obscuribacterales bacterium]
MKGDAKPAPQGNGKDGVKGDAKPAPLDDVKDGVKGDAKPAPQGNGKDGVKGDAKPAPQGDVKDGANKPGQPKTDAQDALDKEAKPENRDTNEGGLQSTGVQEALLLYALYKAAKGLTPREGGFSFPRAVEKIRDNVRYYTGKDLPYARLLPAENGMRLAVDKFDRPVWAEVSKGPNAGEKVIFNWEADGRLAINFENKNGFGGRITSSGKIEMSPDKQSLSSADKSWVVTFPDGTVTKWHGDLKLQPGKSTFQWAPQFAERPLPLTKAPDHGDRQKQLESLLRRAVDGMTESAEAKRAFTFGERQHLKSMYEGIMEGSLPKLESAFRTMCKDVESPARRRQIIDHLARNSGLSGKLSVKDDKGSPHLVFEDPSGTVLAVPANEREKASAYQSGEKKVTVAPADAMLDLVRQERAQRPAIVAALEADKEQAQELQNTRLARDLILQSLDGNFTLSQRQKTTLKELESAFLHGDLERFRHTIQRFDADPESLKPILEEFTRQMKTVNPKFEAFYSLSDHSGKNIGRFHLGDSHNFLSVGTDSGSPAIVAADAQGDRRRLPSNMFNDIAGDIVKIARTQLPPAAEPIPHTPMTGIYDNTGLWHHDYFAGLNDAQRKELQDRLAREYAMGTDDSMRRFTERMGQLVSGWEKTHKEMAARLSWESRAANNLEATEQAYNAVRDEVVKKLGLDRLPPDTPLEHLQQYRASMLKFLESPNARAAGVTDIEDKIKAVEELNHASVKLNDAHKTLNALYPQFEAVRNEVLEAARSQQLPGGLTYDDLHYDNKVIQQFLEHPDAANMLPDAAEKAKAVAQYLEAEESHSKLLLENYEPARKRYEEVRDSVLKTLGADKIPAGMTEVGLKNRAALMEEFLVKHGKEAGIDNLQRKLAVVRDVLAKEKQYDHARANTDALLEERRAAIEKVVNQTAKELGLPSFQVEIGTPSGALGTYNSGKVTIHREHLIHGTAADILDTVYHEMAHGEQQFRILHLMADQYEREKGRAPSAGELANRYIDKMGRGHSVDAQYAERVLEARNGKFLSAEDAAVAEKLTDAWRRLTGVGIDYDATQVEHYNAQKLIERLWSPNGKRAAEQILDGWLKDAQGKDLVPELPGREFESAAVREQTKAVLEELMRERVAFLRGESKTWNAEHAQQQLIEVLKARQKEINSVREMRWAYYGGPDQKHEYDAQVTGKHLQRQAAEHFRKPPEYRALEELTAALGRQRGGESELAAGMKREKSADGKVTFTFDRSQPLRIPTNSGDLEIAAVEARGKDVAILLRGNDGKLYEHKGITDAALSGLAATLKTIPDYQTIAQDPVKHAELIARTLQHSPAVQLEWLAFNAEQKHPGSTLAVHRLPPERRVLAAEPERQAESGNAALRALMDAQTGKATGQAQADGSTFHSLKEPIVWDQGFYKTTIIGTREKNGNVSILVRDPNGTVYADHALTNAYLRHLESQLNTKPVAQAGLRSDAGLAARTLAAALSNANEREINNIYGRYQTRRDLASATFSTALTSTKELASPEWLKLKEMKEAIFNGTPAVFQDALTEVDTTKRSVAAPGRPPTTEFERVMASLERDLALAGYDGIKYEVRPDGVGVVTFAQGDAKVTITTDPGSSPELTRAGQRPQGLAATKDAFHAIGDKVFASLDAARRRIELMKRGELFSAGDLNGKPLTLETMHIAEGAVIARDANADGKTARENVFPQDGSEMPATQTRQIRETDLRRGRYHEFADAKEPGRRFVYDSHDGRVYEVWKANKLTWELTLAERPDFFVIQNEVLNQMKTREMLANTRAKEAAVAVPVKSATGIGRAPEVKPGPDGKSAPDVKPAPDVKYSADGKTAPDVTASDCKPTGGKPADGTLGDSKPQYKKPRRGPAPDLGRIANVEYQQASDGTLTRRAEVAGKPLVGDDKTWKDLLTKDEIEGLKQRRTQLEKEEAEKRITEQGKKELAALRELELKLSDPAAHKQVIERLGSRRPAGGFKGSQTLGTLSGLAILTTAVLGWYIGSKDTHDQTPLKRAGISGSGG